MKGGKATEIYKIPVVFLKCVLKIYSNDLRYFSWKCTEVGGVPRYCENESKYDYVRARIYSEIRCEYLWGDDKMLIVVYLSLNPE